MKVESCQIFRINNFPQKHVVVFGNSSCVQTLKNINIGAAPEGLIGKIKVRNKENKECFLDVSKKIIIDGCENYLVQNDDKNVVGEIVLKVKKYTDYDKLEYQSDPSHVFVSNLFNYSNPSTPYYKKTEQYKDIGTRLLQIALKRSYEAMCNGNLKLVSKNESKNWYKNIIGMTEEFPATQNSPYRFNIHNPNSMILPSGEKEHLANLHGGL